jgi:2'-phosphotransferase
MADSVKISKRMSYYLRHGAQENGLKIDNGGFIKITDLLKMNDLNGVTFDMLKYIVDNNDKKRFEISDDNMYVRAVQGHSMNVVKTEELLRELTIDDNIIECYHGTNKNLISLIMKNGLNKMKRNHVHFSIGQKHDDDVISGMRNSSNATIVLDLEGAMNDGIKFYISQNNVILSAGIDGIVPAKYIKNVIYDKN